MILGVTGGIATGKSSIAALFGELGAVVVSADELARQAVATGSETLGALVAHFGQEILADDGSLDREALAEIIFSDDSARAALDRITHPAIARLSATRLQELRKAGRSPIIYESPLLFEAGADSRVDLVLVVTSDPETQLGRLMSRDNISRDEALARIAAQMPLVEKIARADYVIDNSGSIEQTREEVELMFRELSELSAP